MQKTNHISRYSSIVLVITMLVFSIFGKTISAFQSSKHQQHSKNQQNKPASKNEKSCTVSELSVMQISAPVVVNFHTDFVFNKLDYHFLFSENKFSLKNFVSFRLPLLEILFEHYIVTNAP
ncbi:MAG: hypothetical protein KA313_08960 [Pseudarcicella sp.]|nr:hypothetical protein [Pseudarcicella sp.]MBP6411214.1 hypothetical protein [Pseudarcicella sp.]